MSLVRTWRRELSYCFARHRLLGRNAQRSAGILRPTIVQLQTINRCNGSCVMCPYTGTVAKREREVMSLPLYRRILDQLASWPTHGLLVLCFQNEPFLDERIEDWVAEARHRLSGRWMIELTTNGTRLTASRIERMTKCPPDAVSISINALTEGTYRRVMPGLPWNTLQDNIGHLTRSELRDRVWLRFIRIRDNDGEYGAFRRHWHRRELPVIGFPCNSRLGSVPDYEKIRRVRPTGFERWLYDVLSPAPGGRCRLPFAQMNVLANGDLLLCCNDYRGESVVGNAERDLLESAFNGEAYQRARTSFADRRPGGLCAKCSLLRVDGPISVGRRSRCRETS